MDYVSNTYDNFNDFFDDDRMSAEQLCMQLGYAAEALLNRPSNITISIAWEDNELTVYPSMRCFVLECLAYGLSYDSLSGFGDTRRLPDVEDFVDIDAYGRKLLDEIDKQNALLLPNGKIVTTDVGW